MSWTTSANAILASYGDPEPLELERPTFDYPGETRRQKRKRTQREFFESLPCASCQHGYSRHHECEMPDYCRCDRAHLHVDSLADYADGILERARRGELLDGEEAIEELGSFEPVAVLGKNGRTYVRGRDGKICRHKGDQRQEVRLLDGRLVAWFCTNCDQKGYYPWD